MTGSENLHCLRITPEQVKIKLMCEGVDEVGDDKRSSKTSRSKRTLTVLDDSGFRNLTCTSYVNWHEWDRPEGWP
jgi:hypothetical protein